MTGVAIVTTTVGHAEEASAIAKMLVAEKLAACVQTIPMTSVYRWQGAVDEAAEWMLLCKIRTADYPLVEAAILAAHPYDTPEIVATPVLAGFQPYLDWIAASTAR